MIWPTSGNHGHSGKICPDKSGHARKGQNPDVTTEMGLAHSGTDFLKGSLMMKTRRSSIRRKIGWQVICPTCIKYDYPDHLPDCDPCRELGITENILCTLNRMDQEDAPNDFQCEAYQPKLPLQ
jgi:hypothetical protein